MIATAEQTVGQADARLAEIRLAELASTLGSLQDQAAKLGAERLELQAELQRRADRLAELQQRAAFDTALRGDLPALHDAVGEIDRQLADVEAMLEAVKGRDAETRTEWGQAEAQLRRDKVAELRVLGQKQYQKVLGALAATEQAWAEFGPTQDAIFAGGGVPFDIHALRLFGAPLVAFMP